MIKVFITIINKFIFLKYNFFNNYHINNKKEKIYI